MDFKNLCQNIDVSSLRARIPSLPAMPAMPQIKLPKSLPKLRSRRIFGRSREDLSRNKGSTKEQERQQSIRQLSTQPPIPPADFINHSPCHISTVSSLMHQQQQQQQRGDSQRGTYRSACSVDDDYPSPRQFQAPDRLSRPISPIDGESERVEPTVAKLSLTEKLQKGYKDISEFRLSHIFAKKTVVRKDIILVDQYVERYNEEREREHAEQERHDRKIADNYRFNFKLSRQDTDNSKRSISSEESHTQVNNSRAKNMHEQSEDESGMETTPPPRKPGIASTRFARVRNPPLEQYITDESNNELDEDEEVPAPRAAQQKSKIIQSSPESMSNQAMNRKTLSKLRNMRQSSEETPEKLGERKRRRAPLSPQQSEEKQEAPAATVNENNPLSVLKQNIKRFSKSIRRAQESEPKSEPNANTAEDTDGDGTPKKEAKRISRTEKLAARLRRFASHEASTENLDEATPQKSEEQRSPIRTVITNKLQDWKKSFKRRPTESEAQTGDETSPERNAEKGEKRTDTLMKKLRNIRQQKRANSTDDLDGTEEDEAHNTPTGTTKDANARKTVNFEKRFEQARQRTLKKMNEKMQQIKFFNKSQENLEKECSATKKEASKHDEVEAEEESDDERTVYVRPHTSARRAAARDTPSDSEDEQQQTAGEERVKNDKLTQSDYEYDNEDMQHTRTLWTTKNLLNDSLDSETDVAFPRVLIHQDNSDQFESTLIIAVTRPAPSKPSTPVIEEIHDDAPKVKPPRRSRSPSPGSGRAEWIPNNEIISNFLEITPPSQRRLSAEAILPAPRGHTRKMSMDSNSDSDSWIPDNPRNKKISQPSKEDSMEAASGVTLNSIDENEEPWKVHQHAYCDEKLYKAKSIDIFEASVRTGGAKAAFDDFEDELRDEPILRVPQKHIDSSFEKDSSEEPFAADDDNSSRVTKISVSVMGEECKEIKECDNNKANIKLSQGSAKTDGLNTHLDEQKRKIVHNRDENVDTDEDDDYDRPPSAAPSPPPSISPPPPPLPLRKPILLPSKSMEESTPVPTMKPPMPPTKPPPRIPDRTPSMTRIAKPLVKTSSLRLAYNEQVKPSDVGKVNKLISRFETPQSNTTQRPRVIRRRLTRDESEEYTDDEDDLEEDEDGEQETDAMNANSERDVTPTPTNTPRMYSLESDTESLSAVSTNVNKTKRTTVKMEENITITQRGNVVNGNTSKVYSDLPRITLNFDNNSNLNLSCTSSEYGSPLEYPSSLIGSTETTPIPERRPQEVENLRSAERNRRSMTRDDDKFLSFDSDDENSYYSISSTGSSRYVVEI
nr:zinc finger CCCH domain-containing protein 13 [Bactrocera oleae]